MHYEGQVGDEPSVNEYLGRLIDCTREWMRVLKPSGSLFVNLGDKYENSGGNSGHVGDVGKGQTSSTYRNSRSSAVPVKSLIGLPWRYAIRCVDELGLILRAEVVWAKPNGLPESVTDRVRRSHEQVFHFVRQQRYYSAVDEIREAHTGGAHPLGNGPSRQWVSANGLANNHRAVATDPKDYNPLGKLPGSVWTIPTVPLQVPAHLGVEHFAAYPPGLVRRIVLGWSPREVCQQCGEGRRPVAQQQVDSRYGTSTRGAIAHRQSGVLTNRAGMDAAGSPVYRTLTTITGYACACTPRTSHRGKRGDWRQGREVMPEHGSDDWSSPGNAVPRRPGGFGTKVPPSEGEWEYHFDEWEPPPTRPGVVLDPFGGTGTTALVASCYGRVGISVDLSQDYGRLARWRTTDPGERARVLGVEKPPAQVEGQLGMFEETA